MARGSLRAAHESPRDLHVLELPVVHAQCIEISSRVKAASPCEHHDARWPRHAEVRGRRPRVLRGEPARRHHGSGRRRAERRRGAPGAHDRSSATTQPDLSVWPTFPGSTSAHPTVRWSAPPTGPHDGSRRVRRRSDRPVRRVRRGAGHNVTMETNAVARTGARSATGVRPRSSRIRKFDLQRVFDEIEWCAKSHMQGIGPADSNFGIFDATCRSPSESRR